MSESKTPKVLNPPKRIWLNFGDIDEDVDFSTLRDWECITWCDIAQGDADIEYALASDLAAARAERDALAARVAELSAIAERLSRFTQHADNCGDRDAYNKAILSRCDCGLGDATDALHEIFRAAALAAKEPT